MRILIIEDDLRIASFLRKGLEQECYAVDVAHDGLEGATLAEESQYDLVLLDLNLPSLSGLEVVQRLRKKSVMAPICVLTARNGADTLVNVLDAGADDYIAKPFAFAEVTARIRALLRRSHRMAPSYQIADLVLDPSQRVVTRGGKKIDLSAKEYALLEYLLRHARRTVTRTSIIEHVWDIHFDSVTNVVDVYVNYLRNKIDKHFSPPLIRTIRGVGYTLTDESEGHAA